MTSMTTLSIHESAQSIAREEARLSSGQFGTQEHTAPETTLTTSGPTPKQLAAAGLGGPASENVFAEPWDKDEMRPLRPYLPLTPGYDDEFFDAHPGARLSLVEKDDNGRTRVRSFVRPEKPGIWEERSELRDVFQREVESGELWLELFEEDGAMRSALLHAPVGELYSDQHYFVPRDTIDKPLTVDDAIYRLSGARRGQLVSRSTFGDHRDDGIPKAFQGDLELRLNEDTNHFSFHGAGAQASRGFALDRVQIFDRDGDLVFRQEHEAGHGWEETLRLGDGYDGRS